MASVATLNPSAVPNGLSNGHAGETNGAGPSSTPEPQAAPKPKFATGLILPPPEIKDNIDRTAGAVARSANAAQLEDRIREVRRSDPKFSFLNPEDPFHAYYRHRVEKVLSGEIVETVKGDAVVGQDGAEAVGAGDDMQLDEVPKGPTAKEPPAPQFIVDLPPMSALQLDIIKSTALFTALKGRQFLHNIAQREARNYEFDFLRPTHSLFAYFNTLVEQYTQIRFPEKKKLEVLKEGSSEGARWKILETVKQYAEWERIKSEKEKKKQDDKEAERRAFAEIDWHDYAIVQTIEFTQADAMTELPPPMSVAEMESMTLAQKKMAAMIMENTAEEVEAVRARQAAAEAEAAAAVGSAGMGADGDVSMDTAGAAARAEEEDARRRMEEEEQRREIERARAIQATSMDASGPMKIRTDYVAKLGDKKSKQAMTTCTICGQQIPVNELQEHMRIELLDPRWKHQRDELEARKAQASQLQSGANVDASLRSLAKARVDIFGTEVDEEKRKREEAEEQARRKEREKVVWDGHTASKDRTMDKFQSNSNIEEQIATLHRAKGLVHDASMTGPGIGPSVGPGITPSLPPPPPSLPAPPRQTTSSVPDTAYQAATVSAGPQPASMYGAHAQGAPGQPAPVMLPPLHYQGHDAAQPFGYAPPPQMGVPGMHPARMAAMQGAPPMQAGMVRSADQMEGGAGGPADDIPPAKRQRVQRLPGGQYYPEQDWINLHPHPISLQIQLPNDQTKPEWKLDGSVVTLSEIPVSYLVSTVRDVLARQTGSSMPLSRITLSYNGKMLTNANTIASYNIEDEDMLVLSLRDAKKKK